MIQPNLIHNTSTFTQVTVHKKSLFWVQLAGVYSPLHLAWTPTRRYSHVAFLITTLRLAQLENAACLVIH